MAGGLRFWENRLKLMLAASLVYAILISLLAPSNGRAAPPGGDAALQIALRIEFPMANPFPFPLLHHSSFGMTHAPGPYDVASFD